MQINSPAFNQEIIRQTQQWITEVVVGCNFCPFAARVLKQQTVHYQVQSGGNLQQSLTALAAEAARLDADTTIETSFLIFPETFAEFEAYLSLVDLAEELLRQNGYEGVYQLASFHPQYLFAGSHEQDAANYTNRSLYPMLHLLRESSIDSALEHYKDPGQIPDRNIDFARKKGLTYMKMLRDSCRS